MRHYTQNIDTLERVAGIPDDKLVEAHGTFYTGHCRKCGNSYTLEWMKGNVFIMFLKKNCILLLEVEYIVNSRYIFVEKIFSDELPSCEKKCCKGVVKPDIVFFGESLPNRFYHCMETDFSQCDLLIILGSSLVVQPFASLVDR